MKKPHLPPNSKPVGDDWVNLTKVMQDTEVYSKLQKVEKSYPYWDEFKYRVKETPEISAELQWMFAKFTRSSSYSQIIISDIEGFSFKYQTTQSILKYLHEFDMNLGGFLEGGSIIPSEDKNRYLISSIMEEAIASSRLEGAVTTREVAKKMLMSDRKPRNVSERMIVNNYLTIKRVIELKDEKLTKELILEIHALISKDTLSNPSDEGKFRESNSIKVTDNSGEVFYDPPDFNKIDKLMDDFCLFVNSPQEDHNFLHPIIKAIILHFLIGYIHPFADGNGRTARAIFYWYMVSKNYWLIEYLSLSRIIVHAPAQYARAYLHTEYDENDLTYFLNYNLKSLDLALKSLKLYINRKVQEKKVSYKLIQHETINTRQSEILSEFLHDTYKSYSITELVNQFGVVYQTARTDLFGLVKLGYLVAKKINNKKLVFFRSPDFDKKMKVFKYL